MSKKLNYFDRLHVPTPCPADWDSMIGDDRARYCSECDKNVYNLSKMTRDRAEALVARMQGRLCARFERQPDGTIVTEENFTGIHLISRRASPVASAVVSAMLGIGGSVVAQTPSQPGEPVATQSRYGKNKDTKQPRMPDVPASVTGTVADQQGAVIAGATITLINTATGEERVATSSDEGTFRFISLEASTYSLKVQSTGFMTFTAQNLTLKPNDQLQFNATLQVGKVISTGGVILASPQPLRTLYRDSDLIVVARIGKSVEAKTEKHDGGGESALMKTTLEVSSFIKGTSRKRTIYVYHWGWGEDRKFPGGFDRGDSLLVFLDRREEGKGYEVNDLRYGVKKLPADDLDIYIERIKELAAIMQQEEPDANEIIEWLVRCAEQPATRWEGAYELAWNEIESLKEEGASLAACKADSTADDNLTVNAGEQAVDESSDDDESDFSSKLAALLTSEQKERLATALFNTDKLAERDEELIQIVKSWKDERLLPFLVSQLRKVEDDPLPIAEQLMEYIAELLDDEEIASLADEYHENVSYEDLEEEEESQEMSDDANREGEESEEAEDEIVDPLAAKQQRSALLKKFLMAVEKKMAR